MSSALDVNALLEQLIHTWENEVIEFKEAGKDYDTDKIGRYFSALANEANLREQACAWLVFGVDNKTRQVVGTSYRSNHAERLQSTKHQISNDTQPNTTFRQIHEHHSPDGRVVLFEIPAAPRGIPIAWKGHYYARAGESIAPLSLNKLDTIRQQTQVLDWSAQVVHNAQLSDLDDQAIATAKKAFIQKYANRFKEEDVWKWSVETFLDRSRLTQAGQITRAALLLLGKRESAYLLSPHPVEMTWRLLDEVKAYEHFGPPFLLNTTALYRKIRNFQMRLLPHNALLPIEVPKYDQKMILEALHNCIAHQDYQRNARIVVSEYSNRLQFDSEGEFFEGQPTDYLKGDKTPRRYRNPFLVQAMVELNMIDTMGYGIYQIHQAQAARFLPLPDYDLSEPKRVCLTVYGNVVDPAYSRLLMQNTELSFSHILALDRVQKNLEIPADTAHQLRKAGLIEGRKPNYHISSHVAQATENKADYIKTRRQDDTFYKQLILDYLKQFGEASRKEIDTLLVEKLSPTLNHEQKSNKIANLLTNLRRSKHIVNKGSRTASRWTLNK